MTEKCADCTTKDAVIAQPAAALAKQTPPQVTIYPTRPPSDTVTAPTVYDRCSCNPKNGGSGMCGCTMGGTRVTCYVGTEQLRAEAAGVVRSVMESANKQRLVF